MKYLKICLPAFVLIFIQNLKAEEGMWLPMLLKQLNEADMRRQGFKLTAEDIYRTNGTSMKDAVVLFGGGCTGEIISNSSLLLTNHHCGYSQIQSLSTIEKNYLKHGYWAYKQEEELPCPGLTVSFVIRIDDVTKQITDSLNAGMNESERNEKIKRLSNALEMQAVAGTHYKAQVRPYYYGNEFYMIVTETFTDVRFVGAPPETMGNFGGETDNWIWPRHTADFSLFRIYAGADNKPAAYSKDNKPFVPRYFFPISTKGVKEGDFTMVYGFPGRTQQYLPSVAVDFIVSQQDPTRVAIRDVRLANMYSGMRGNDSIHLKYASKAKSLANAYKKWKGEMEGIRETKGIDKKRMQEVRIKNYLQANSEAQKQYGNVFEEFNKLYEAYKPLSRLQDYTNEAALGVELIEHALSFSKLIIAAQTDTLTDTQLSELCNKQIKVVEGFYKNYNHLIDKNNFIDLLTLYGDSINPELQPEELKKIKNGQGLRKYAEVLFAKSFFANQQKMMGVLRSAKRKKIIALQQDEAYQLAREIAQNYNQYTDKINAKISEINLLMRKYMRLQREADKERIFYPDANSTLRVTYGTMRGYNPRNGVFYLPQTTSAGIIQKNNTMQEDFDAPAKLIDMFSKQEIPTCFIAANHTTGGNSGSPVLNDKGELIGTNFDRVWEGTMSDLNYDVSRCRNIALDVRYTLWIIGEYAQAKNLISEMKLVSE
ncbi:MAG: S46 family peptidase [Bacteroidetes bacterium]|nr:S46 family peptidase [Bacteroidota bacterium]